MASNNSVGRDLDEPVAKLRHESDIVAAEARQHVAKEKEEESEAVATALLFEHLQRPATINSLEVHGAKNTRRTFLDPVFQPLVEDSRNAGTTLGSVLQGLKEATDKLQRFDIFHQEPLVRLSDARASDQNAAGTDLDIAISVREKSRLIFKAGTDVGNAEGSAYTNALWRNIFGGAETLSVNASAGTRTRSAYSAVFSTPVNSNPDVRLSLEGLASSTQKPWASHEEVLKGATARLAWLARPRDAAYGGSVDTHTVAYSHAWRQLTGLADSASPTVRADAGDSLKSSITHTFTRDRRDNPMLPQSGYLLKTTSELAGWGLLKGDVAFAKSEVEASAATPVSLPGFGSSPSGISVGAGFRAGLLYPLPLGYSLTGRSQPSRINDRFQLGGPTDVRGFTQGGLGPRHGVDAVGGDVYAAGGVNMLLPLPRAGPTSPLRLQLFANGGRLVALQNTASGKKDGAVESRTVVNGVSSAIGELGNGLPSIAAGVGLVYAHPVARFELNFSLPLVSRRGEEGRKGLQVGVGINFL
ncbi:sorting assembly machinery 50 kDa subunit [Coniochaeta sp. 2T2.1]|nr:sorting assembly machinery 50 kDa subunit [Coniochaeta sp. 2T2.1]